MFLYQISAAAPSRSDVLTSTNTTENYFFLDASYLCLWKRKLTNANANRRNVRSTRGHGAHVASHNNIPYIRALRALNP